VTRVRTVDIVVGKESELQVHFQTKRK